MSAATVHLGAVSLAAGHGGIARVARLMARALCAEITEPARNLSGLVLRDEPPGDLGFAIASAQSSRLRYVAGNARAAVGHRSFVYDFVGTARAHRLLPRRLRPFMTFIHGIEIWDRSRSDRARTARRADVLLANSRYTLERAVTTHGRFPAAQVCWLATEADYPPTTQRDHDRRPEILFCGRVADAYKGHFALIDGWRRVLHAVPDARLSIVGSGSESLRGHVQLAGVGDHVDLRGFVSEAEMEALFARATAFAMPSRGEGFGLVYIEAMRHALPVIASTHDAAVEINVDGETGYNVDLDRRDDLTERIITMLRDRDLARRLGERGQQRWREHFRFSAFHRRFAPFIHRLVES